MVSKQHHKEQVRRSMGGGMGGEGGVPSTLEMSWGSVLKKPALKGTAKGTQWRKAVEQGSLSEALGKCPAFSTLARTPDLKPIT